MSLTIPTFSYRIRIEPFISDPAGRGENRGEAKAETRSLKKKEIEMKKMLLLVAVLLLTACAPAVPSEIEITPMAAPMVGRPAPDFGWTVESVLKTEEQKLSEFRGQVVLLVFWSPYCPHCVDEMPVLQVIQERYKDKLAVISVTTDTTSAWQKVKEEIGFTFLVLVNPQGEIFNEYWIRGVPALFVIDQEGIIQARFDGAVPESQIEDALAPLLER